MKRVYFIRPVGEDGPVKIGCSHEPIHRLKSVQVWSPLLLEVAAYAEGSHDHERAMQRMFIEDHLHGEWFRASDKLNRIIASVAATGALPLMEISRTAPGLGDRRRQNKGVTAEMKRRVAAAERHAYGYGDAEFLRPEPVAEIYRKIDYLADHQITGKEMIALKSYIADLKSFPASDRSRDAWLLHFRRDRQGNGK